ncbi:aldose 1-epimerase [Robbsia andropogonis]|uniref:aldose 1-epimerase n=1 Tax=Robbsia andropogonis TaxID=28092 RepID=UPI002A69C9BB|nr:aldose 1-epimerase [Robbsia andropogonis]
MQNVLSVPSSAAILTLSAGTWTASVCPSLGGAIVGLWRSGREVLRGGGETDVMTGNIRALACFPLVPFSNRIDHGSFYWQGARYRLPPDDRAAPHALHGIGLRRAWQVTSRDIQAVTMVLRHRADAYWPFDFAALQTIRLDDSGMTCRLELVNDSGVPAPAGLEWHPYFPLEAGTRLVTSVGTIEIKGDDGLPTAVVPPPKAWSFHTGVQMADIEIDHCFHGWAGTVTLSRQVSEPDAGNIDGHEVLQLIASEPLRSLILYRPAGQSFFCIEPVTHGVDVINRALPGQASMQALPPGQRLCVEMRIAYAHC